MRIYRVGGWVRDTILGKEPKDEDFVVVGATYEEMIGVGFNPISAAFPIFTDDSGREYALARRERSTGDGHTEFTVEFGPEVTLREDLERRDLTVNAMAVPVDGDVVRDLIDPFGGLIDLASTTLRQVSRRSFIEDPLRVPRVARFAAQLGFNVCAELIDLMGGMKESLRSLTAERVFMEVDKALRSARPSRFFRALDKAGVLDVVLPEVAAMIGVCQSPQWHAEGDVFEHTMRVLDQASILAPGDQYVAWSALCHDLGKTATPLHILPSHPKHESASEEIAGQLLDRLRAPTKLRSVVTRFCKEHMRGKKWQEMRPGKVVRLLESVGALGHTAQFARMDQFINLLEADCLGREGGRSNKYTRGFYSRALKACSAIRGIDVLMSRPGKEPGEWVRDVMMQMRVEAVRSVIEDFKEGTDDR